MDNKGNLNQQPVNQGTSSNVAGTTINAGQTTNTTVEPVASGVQNIVQPFSNAVQPVVNSVQSVSNVQTSQQVPQQQRVQLINNKPAIQAIVPNNNVISKPANPEVSEEEKVEMLEDDASVSNESAFSDNKGSKLRTFFLMLLFGGLFVMIIFLPDISSYIQTQKYLKTQKEEVITTGTLKCEFENSSDDLDYNYLLDFSFKDSKLTRLTYVSEIRGDINLDAEKLDLLKKECDQLELNAEQLSGVSVSCELNGSILSKKQVLNYSGIDVNEAISAYMEAGGVYPDYENGQSIDEIEKEMNASGYSCQRIK